ncbi:MAG: hypothetical protein FWE18_01105 [Alphaproteobacteria bacterium]|nr:hypothetical protein [Alphaproteobacteria bacterium]
MSKFKLFYLPLLALFLLLPNYSKADTSDSVSGGKVIFEGDVNGSNQSSGVQQGESEQTIEAGDLSSDTQDSTKENIKKNIKRDKREAALDDITMFKPDQAQNLYNINVLVLRINVKRDKVGRVLGLLPEGQEQPTTFINNRNNPDYFLNLAMGGGRDTEYANVALYETHKALLKSFVQKVPKDQDAIILMYVNGSNLKTHFDREMQLEKTIYSQFVTDFLYRNKRKLIIEKRYIDDIPEDEIFLVISRFEGNTPPNVYNSSKGNILQWLARYKELERQNVQSANSARADLENSLNSTTSTKSSSFLSTPVKREIQEENNFMSINENALFQRTRDVKARPNPNGDNGGPRRVAPRPEVQNNAVSEADIQADESAQLNQENQAIEAQTTVEENAAAGAANTTQNTGNTAESIPSEVP